MHKVVMLTNDFYATGDIYIEDNILYSKIPTEALIQEQLVSGPRVNLQRAWSNLNGYCCDITVAST